MATPYNTDPEEPAAADDSQKNIVRRHYFDLAQVLALFPDVLLSLSMRFYQHSFIDLHTKRDTKSSINRLGGLHGASMLLDHVMMKIEQSDQYLPLVMDILREEVALKDIVQKMEKGDSNDQTMNDNRPEITHGEDVPITTPPPSTNSQSPEDVPSVTDTISSAERLKTLFESLCFLAMMVLSQASVDQLMLLKLKIDLHFQYTRENTPEVQGHLAEMQECNKCESVLALLIRKKLLGYLNFDLLDIVKLILSSDEFNDKLQEYQSAHKEFIKNNFMNIVEAFQLKPDLRPASVVGLPKIKVRLQEEWKGRSLYDWNEVVDIIIQWGQYITIAEVELNCVTITYQVLPFILPRVITDLTNDTIVKRFSSIGATFIIPDEILKQGMADQKWIMDTIQEQQVMKKTRHNERGEDPVISGPVQLTTDTITDQPLEEPPPVEGGYDDEIFLTPPPIDLQCPVCCLTVREPRQLTCCGSTLCQVCSEKSNAGIQCPCCRDTNHQIMVDKSNRRRVMSLKVKCTVTDCHWIGELLDWNKHIMDKKKCPRPKGYDTSIFPEWCYHGLSSLQYETLPVYRTTIQFHKHKQNNEELFTDPFYTSNGGYKATLNVVPNGDGYGKGTHVSVGIYLMKEPNDDNLPFPINGIFTVQMLNWKEDHHHIEESIAFDDSTPIEYRERVTRGERAVGTGKSRFLSHNDVSSMNVLNEDMMCFKISYIPIDIQTGCFPVPSWCDVMYSTLTTPPCTRTLYGYTAYKKTNSEWCSQPFYSTDNGYKLQLRVTANGVRSSKGTHLTLYVHLMKGDYDDTLSWPFNANIAVQLLNWSSDSHHVEKTIPHHTAPLECRQRVVDGDRAPDGFGYRQFISHNKLQDTSDHTVTFINNDNICFRITSVDII